jgi:hypothetical protein
MNNSKRKGSILSNQLTVFLFSPMLYSSVIRMYKGIPQRAKSNPSEFFIVFISPSGTEQCLLRGEMSFRLAPVNLRLFPLTTPHQIPLGISFSIPVLM